MAGIYLHIPFCKKKCNYCDFYSIRNSSGIEDLVNSEIRELILRRDYLDNELVETIYFGGGTPSILNIGNIVDVISCIRKNFKVSDHCEITFEANPDDLSDEYLLELHQVGINRLSIGIQSFNDDILRFLGRRHDSTRLNEIVDHAKKRGFENISVDLIFGIPGMDFDTYLDSLNKVIKLEIQHVSAYSLTIEKGTYFHKLLNKGEIKEIEEHQMLQQFEATMDILSENGFPQYEISNYSVEQYRSRHNCSYWNNVKYLGIGPSAHSYNQSSRQWNISETKRYCANVGLSKPFYEIEILTLADKFNEYLITGLRTVWGVSMSYINDHFDITMFRHFSDNVNKLVLDELVSIIGDRVILTRKGLLISDYILRLLYYM